MKSFASSDKQPVLVVVVHTKEDGSLHRKHLPGRDLRLGEGFAEVVGDAHDFTSGFHLRAEYRINARELCPTEIPATSRRNKLRYRGRLPDATCSGKQLLQLLADHEA